jgi:asparagine synthase (glutamine-hydrolysing)
MASLDGRTPVEPGVLATMNACLVHRGPDSTGAWADGHVGLAVRRLAIIDLAGGEQPIRNEDGSVTVVHNGEIYNYAALRAELAKRGHDLATHSDTEVLVHLYEDEGVRFVERLRGMFAIALWDARRRRLVLARDRFGIKPLHYRADRGALSFASEMKALATLPGFDRAVDPEALEAYFTFGWIPAPLSIYRGVRKLPPGHLLTLEDGRVDIVRYARPQPAGRDALLPGGIDELAEATREALRDSMRAHLVADVPVGVLLSGGVDSSLLTALAAQESSERVRTFSIGFHERAYDELDRARLVARHYDTEHTELTVDPDAAALLPRLVDAFDEPFADSSALPTYVVSELTAGHVKVALAGEGGDELFGGYFTYVADALAPRTGRAAAALRPLIERLPSGSGSLRLDDKAKRFARAATLPPVERHCAWTQLFGPQERAALIVEGRRGTGDPLAAHRARFAETVGAPALARYQDLDVGFYLADDLLTKADRTSMAHSLELRVPFLDPKVHELAGALPTAAKVRHFEKKRVLRAAARPLLPPGILEARKQGFSIPAAAWLRGPLEPLLRETLDGSTLSRQGFVRPVPVQALVEEHLARRADNSRQLWSLLFFTLWADRTGVS